MEGIFREDGASARTQCGALKSTDDEAVSSNGSHCSLVDLNLQVSGVSLCMCSSAAQTIGACLRRFTMRFSLQL